MQRRSEPELIHKQRRHKLYYGEVFDIADWPGHMSHRRFPLSVEPQLLCASELCLAHALIPCVFSPCEQVPSLQLCCMAVLSEPDREFLLSLCRREVLRIIAVPLLLVTSVSVGCAIYEGLRPDSWRSLTDLSASFGYSLVSFALALLLVFKTNTSYARYWEGAPPLCFLAALLLAAHMNTLCHLLPPQKCTSSPRTSARQQQETLQRAQRGERCGPGAAPSWCACSATRTTFR